MLAAFIGGDQRAVVAAGDDARAVGRAGEDPPAWMATRRSPSSRRKQQRLLAQHEHRRLAEKMHADDRRARRDRADAVGERGHGGGGVGHSWVSSCPLPLWERVPSERE